MLDEMTRRIPMYKEKERPYSSKHASEEAREALLGAIDAFLRYISVGDNALIDMVIKNGLKEEGTKLAGYLDKTTLAIKSIEGSGAEWGERIELLDSIFKTIDPGYIPTLGKIGSNYLEHAYAAIFPPQNQHAKEPATDIYKSAYEELYDDALLSYYILALTKYSRGKENQELGEEGYRLYNLSKNTYKRTESILDRHMEGRIEQVKGRFLAVFENVYSLNETELQGAESKLRTTKRIGRDIDSMLYDISIKRSEGFKERRYALEKLGFINGKVHDAEVINLNIMGLKNSIRQVVLGEDSEEHYIKLVEAIYNELSNFITLFDSKARDVALEAADGLYRELQKALVGKREMLGGYIREIIALEEGALPIFRARKNGLLEDAKAMGLDIKKLPDERKYLR